MSQSRRLSFLEALANLVVGYAVAFATQLVVFPAVGLQASLRDHLCISAAFVAVSLTRSYVLRRLFNRLGSG
jgi:hypothetical protein